MATFSVHFDGPITIDHRVPIRVLSKTYEHMQRAIDRAYLIELHGEVWKHARLTDNQYRETEFIAEYPREGGIILDAVRDGAEALLDRVANAVRPVFERSVQQAIEQQESIAVQLAQRHNYVQGMRENTMTYEQIAENPPADWANAYSNRSVVKEVDQLVAQVTPRELEGSIVEITLNGNVAHLPFAFTAPIARRFHVIASRRELAAPMIVNAKIRSLDRGNRFVKPSAKIENLSTNREVNLVLPRREAFDELHPYHNAESVRLYACPVVEAMGFDLHGGDLMYLAVVQ